MVPIFLTFQNMDIADLYCITITYGVGSKYNYKTSSSRTNPVQKSRAHTQHIFAIFIDIFVAFCLMLNDMERQCSVESHPQCRVEKKIAE